MTNPNIVSAVAPDAEWIADLVGDSFMDLGVTEWLVPDAGERAKILPRNFQIHIEYALTYGDVHVFSDRSAAAARRRYSPRWENVGCRRPNERPASCSRQMRTVCYRLRHLGGSSVTVSTIGFGSRPAPGAFCGSPRPDRRDD